MLTETAQGRDASMQNLGKGASPEEEGPQHPQAVRAATAARRVPGPTARGVQKRRALVGHRRATAKALGG